MKINSLKKFFALTLMCGMVLVTFTSCKKTVKVGNVTLDASKIFNIYIAQSINKGTLDDMRKGFVVGLKDLGLVEDINVKYTYENAKGEPAYADKIADDINEKKPDLVVAIGATVATKVFEKCRDIPIVFLGCANADRLGFCDADGKPLGEITGVKDSHLIEEQLDFIETNYPNVKKLGIIFNANNPLAQYDVDYFKFYATAHDIDIYTVSIKKATDVDTAIDKILPKVDAINLVIDDMVETKLDTIVAKSRNADKPVFGRDKENDADGVIIPKTIDMQKIGKAGANMANDILKGNKKASEINVETVDFN